MTLFPDWTQFDHAHLWHPYATITDPPPVYPVVAAEGVELVLQDGRRLIDGMSSWWAAIHGYNHPVLNQAVTQQLGKMAHVMFGGLTHEPAATLAKRLLDIAPKSLDHVFFADSGSVAVEVAIKMAIQCWIGRGQPEKYKILTVRHGYHGDTFGAMSVSDPDNGMHHLFRNSLAPQLFADAPLQDAEPDVATDLINFEQRLSTHQHEIAAVILEPIVQGAGGMRFYRPSYLSRVAKLCREYRVLLILDEIATGFGRTGTLFAAEQANVEPDIMCVGKALTGGYMTLAATLVNHQVAQDICQGEAGALMHGPTFMANPLACAVANASIKLLLSQDWQTQVRGIERQLQAELEPCRHLPNVADVRVKGAIGVVKTHAPVSNDIQRSLVDAGVWLRPFNHLIYLMPPYIITETQLNRLTQAIYKVLVAQGK